MKNDLLLYYLNRMGLNKVKLFDQSKNVGTLVKILTNYAQLLTILKNLELEIPENLNEIFVTVGNPSEKMSYNMDCFLVGMQSSIDILYFRQIW